MSGHALTDPEAGHGLGHSRRAVLEELRGAGSALGVQEISDRTGLHPNTARFHLDGLVGAGLAERQAEDRTRPGRPRTVYRAVAVDAPAGLRSYRLLAEMLTGLVAGAVPDPRRAALTAGRSWGRFLVERPAPLQQVDEDDAVRRLSAVLDDIGFAPGPPENDDTKPVRGARRHAPSPAHGRRVIPLRHCPFREIAAMQQEVVCSLHLGLMQGVLAEVRAPLDAQRLDPFVQPSLCLAHLAARDGQPGATPPRQMPAPARSRGITTKRSSS